MFSTARQEELRAAFRAFAQAEILPRAAEIDHDQRFPEDLIRRIAEQGYLAPWLPRERGGQGMDFVTYGVLTEEVGRACSSSRSLLTSHGMVTQAIARWGDEAQKRSLLPQLAAGQRIAAFALTEPTVGSNAAKPQSTAVTAGNRFLLNGEKSWVTFGQRADVFLVLARYEGETSAFLVDRDSPGLTVSLVDGLLGTRGAMLANLRFEDCLVPKKNIVGKPGFGFTMVASEALDHGRYSVAWGCVGLLRACLEASATYTGTRRQFGTEIREHQLVRQMITDMMTSLRCAELLCRHAGELKDQRDSRAIAETMMAKYYASTSAVRAAGDAVQLHGANGVSDRYPVARYYRDAKIMEIIEGSTQILQTVIAKYAYTDLPAC
jgi:alkylation response protein AidB-like acyl-CoA dehydrogenase